MKDAPYTSLRDSSDFMDVMANQLASGVGYLLRAMTASPVLIAATGAQQEDCSAVEPAVPGCISMFHCRSRESEMMGVYYQSYVVPQAHAQAWCQTIADNYSDGQEMVDRLMQPFTDSFFEGDSRAWLSSHVVSTYLEGLPKPPGVQLLDPGFYHNPKFISTLPSRAKLLESLNNASKIWWPICDGGHWYLMIIERMAGTRHYVVKVLDSFNNQSKHAEIAARGHQLVEMLCGKQTPKVLLNKENPSYFVPTQHNAVDCGTAICYYAYQLAQGQSLTTYCAYHEIPCEYTHFRLQMAQSIAINVEYNKKGTVVLRQKMPCVIDLVEDEQPRSQISTRTRRSLSVKS